MTGFFQGLINKGNARSKPVSGPGATQPTGERRLPTETSTNGSLAGNAGGLS